MTFYIACFLSCVDQLNLLQKNLNSSLNLIEDHNDLSKNIHYDIDKKKDIYQKGSKYSDDINSIKMQLRIKIKLI